jgi:hypothetical protein
MFCRFAVGLALFAATAFADAPPISDETLHTTILQTIFKGMQISAVVPERSDPSPPDALAPERAYQITGKPANKAEQGSATNAATGALSETRHVRIRPFRWPGQTNSGLLAVVQYAFPRANASLCCSSIGLLVHLAGAGENWQVRGEYLLETRHHSSLRSIRLTDLTGKGANDLIVESDAGGGATAEIILKIFDLSRGRFEEILDQHSYLEEYVTEQGYSQAFDLRRTLLSHGTQFCFEKTLRFENGRWFTPPRVSHPCYKRGAGVDPKDSAERNEWLAPLF